MTLIEEAKQLLGMTLTPEQDAQFNIYQRELADWNTRMNLTAITEPDEVRVRHFLDSLSIAMVMGFDPGDKVVDVGTGAGFPGLPLAIAYPQVSVTLMDATAKKITFLEHVANECGLTNLTLVHARAEDAGNDPAHREQYDVVVARAVARLPSLLEYMLPLAKIGGFCIAMKGETAAEELVDSKRALYMLGGEAKPIEDVTFPQIDRTHFLVTVEKVKKTPKTYPRKAGTPTRKPIGF
ncbi:MAG: 16S rRNA (guanine(527)-N(7))-methyltransferase RsmG [Anaerolineaceae bacterium]|nr:16S rRNA (guanine(527)-N(7))-methyltransferase RsmG [Anaerolineaceae bacterium]